MYIYIYRERGAIYVKVQCRPHLEAIPGQSRVMTRFGLGVEYRLYLDAFPG